MKKLFVTCVMTSFLVGALAVACGDDEGAVPTPTLEPSPSATASATFTPEPAVSPAASLGSVVPDEVVGRRVVFLREVAPYSEMGELWIGSLDGSERERLSAQGEVVKFAGLATGSATGNETVFYVSNDGGFRRTLWSLDRVTSVRSVVVEFESYRDDVADAAVSTDGRYAVYAAASGIEMLDTASGTTKHLLDNGPRECDAGTCFSHSRPLWSPDGTLLIVRKTFWEGGTTIVMDPLRDPIEKYTDDQAFGPWTSNWSAGSDAACGHSLYAEPSGIFIANGPAWEFVDMLPSYANSYPVARYVSSCSWLDDRFVSFAVNVSRPDSEGTGLLVNSVELRVFDRETREERPITEDVGDLQIWTGEVVALPSTSFVVTQRRVDDGGNGSGEWTRPELIDIDTGERTSVLEEGDLLVGLAP